MMYRSFPNTNLLSIALGLLITVFVFSDLAYGGGDLYEQLDRPVLSQTEQLDAPSSLLTQETVDFQETFSTSQQVTGFSYFLPYQLALLAELKASILTMRSQQLADQMSNPLLRFLFPIKRGLPSEAPSYS